MTDDDDISRRYRALPREEPPRHLDDAILAAARRAARTRPAPLVVPSGRQRWYFPLAAAAIIVLAVAVTVHMEREQPAEELMSTSSAPAASTPSAPAAAAPAVVPSARELDRKGTAAQPERKREARSADAPPLRDQRADAAPPPELQKAQPQDTIVREQNAAGALIGGADALKSAPAPAAAPKAAPPPPAFGAERPAPQARAEQRRADEGARAASVLSAYAMQSPEQWLQGIADLRKQSRHDEADKELAEFRKRHPAYEIPPAMRERVERR